jgi:type IV secretory pathway VirB6-like protein
LICQIYSNLGQKFDKISEASWHNTRGFLHPSQGNWKMNKVLAALIAGLFSVGVFAADAAKAEAKAAPASAAKAEAKAAPASAAKAEKKEEKKAEKKEEKKAAKAEAKASASK